VVSKCDRSDANRTLVDLKQMLTLGLRAAAKSAWPLPVVGTSTVSGEGIDELIAAIERHRRFGLESEAGQQRRLAIAQFRLRKTADNLLLDRFGAAIARASAPLAAKLMRREADPYSLANELLNSSLLREPDHEQDTRSKIA
jgi:LAO/AO transport system kinase